MKKQVFAFDCGSTNWRIYRATYELDKDHILLIDNPRSCSPSSFTEGRLRAAFLLNQQGSGLDVLGEQVLERLQNNPKLGERMREYFKPYFEHQCEEEAWQHPIRHTAEEALYYTQLLLNAVLEQLQREKWQGRSFGENVHFAFAYPGYWQNKEILESFKQTVRRCLPQSLDDSQVSFVCEADAAVIALKQHGLRAKGNDVILVIDVGGSTSQLTLGHMDPDTGKLAPGFVQHFNRPFGAWLYDDVLAQYLAQQLKIPPDELAGNLLANQELKARARLFKEELNRQFWESGRVGKVQLNVTVGTDKDVYVEFVSVDGELFADLTQELSDRFERLIDDGLQAMRLSARDVRHVALVGGGMQILTIRQHLTESFGTDKIVIADNPDETIAHGLALEYELAFKTPKPDDLMIAEIETTVPKQKEPRPGTAGFKILVWGDSNRGKSTFINAMLGQEVLPGGALPDTAIITEIKWGEEPRAMLHFKKDNGGKILTPKEIPVNELEEHIAINDWERSTIRIPYEKVELFGPFELCRNGVEIIDTPGFNAGSESEAVNKYLETVDVILFVVSCEQLGPSTAEREAIKEANECGHKDIFYVCNFFDRIRPVQRKRIQEYAYENLGRLTEPFGKERIFFISAIEALDGRLEDNEQLVKRSGILLVEAALEKFMTVEVSS